MTAKDGGFGPESGGFGKAFGGDPDWCAVDVDAVGAALLGEAVEEERPVLGGAQLL
jgi:hypothetical protein